jgi:hypothetical protein
VKEPNRHPRTCCLTKEKYATPQIAWAQIRRMPRKEQPFLSSYKCIHCGLYHVGHNPGAASTDKRRSR